MGERRRGINQKRGEEGDTIIGSWNKKKNGKKVSRGRSMR